jgi:hypothetical protein
MRVTLLGLVRMAMVATVSAVASCAAEAEPTGTGDEALFADPRANPTSPRLGDAYVRYARDAEIVAVAGTNAGNDAHGWRVDELGSEEKPLRHEQSLEAATSLHEIAGTGRTEIWAWGWPEVDRTRTYAYRANSGKTYALHFLADDPVAPAYGDVTTYTESHVRDDATRLRGALDAAPLGGRQVMLVGHSWGGAIVDYGKTQTTDRRPPDAQHPPILGNVRALAFAAPKDLPTSLQPWPFIGLGADGEYDEGRLLVRRRPDDLVGKGGLWPVLSGFGGPTHNYTMASHDDGSGAVLQGGFWGISGPGLLCSAAFGNNCP